MKNWQTTNLTCDSALQRDRGICLEKFELLQNLNTLLVVRDQLEILVRNRQLEICDAVSQDAFDMQGFVLNIHI